MGLEVKSMLSVEAQNYLKSVLVSDDYSINFNTLCTVSLRLSELNISDSIYRILLCYSNINNLVGSIVSKNLEIIKKKGSLVLSKDKVFCDLINAYCIINNSFFEVKSYNDYYRFIDNVAVLSAEDEKLLFELLDSSDNEIKSRVRKIIIICNLRFVRSLAYSYSLKNTKFPFEELMEEGIFGLIKAIDNFDFSRCNKFSTYAHDAINQRIITYCNHDASPIKFSHDFSEKKMIYQKIKNDYIRLYGQKPSYEYMKEKFRLSWRYELSDAILDDLIGLIENYSKDVYSLSMPISSKEDYCLENIIPDDSESFYEKLEDNELSVLFEKVFDEIGLSDRDREIIYYKYGMKGYPELTLKKISSIVGVTYQRVQQIDNRILKKINKSADCRYILSGYHK